MDAVGLDARTVALMLARGRIGVGVVASLLPKVAAAVAPGAHGAPARAFSRMAGARDLALGLGALTCVKEGTQDAEWVGMGGAVDVIDGVTLLATRGLPVRARLVGLVALSAGIAGIACARVLADERAAALEPTPGSGES
jgi:hypothetical protein